MSFTPPILKTIAHFEIPFLRYLDTQGIPEQALPAFVQDKALMIALYRMMLQTRIFDTKAIALQRTGKLGTYPSTLGQEAICVGIGAAMKPEDVLCPYYREYGAQFWRGVSMEHILLYWGGDERGSDFTPKHDFPICVPIASQNLHAVGVATAFKLKKEARVAVTTVGDAGTSRGDFYEAINVAGVWNLPVVFVINNNQWGISTPRSMQTKAQTLAQKGIAGGIDCLQIDGNDLIAVKESVSNAIEKARAGHGATVIEALTYRLCDHTTADDATRYRPVGELEAGMKLDPMIRFRRYLEAQGWWGDDQEQQFTKEIQGLVAQAVKNYTNTPKRAPESMFDHLYAQLPRSYHDQWLELKKGAKNA